MQKTMNVWNFPQYFSPSSATNTRNIRIWPNSILFPSYYKQLTRAVSICPFHIFLHYFSSPVFSIHTWWFHFSLVSQSSTDWANVLHGMLSIKYMSHHIFISFFFSILILKFLHYRWTTAWQSECQKCRQQITGTEEKNGGEKMRVMANIFNSSLSARNVHQPPATRDCLETSSYAPWPP